MISPKFYTKDDYKVLQSWWDARKIAHIPERYLSTMGIMVENVACGFIYTTDSAMAIIENFVSNPETPKDIRNKALDLIIECMLDYCLATGIESIVAFSELPVIVERAKKFSFVVPEGSYKMMTRRV